MYDMGPVVNGNSDSSVSEHISVQVEVRYRENITVLELKPESFLSNFQGSVQFRQALFFANMQAIPTILVIGHLSGCQFWMFRHELPINGLKSSRI